MLNSISTNQWTAALGNPSNTLWIAMPGLDTSMMLREIEKNFAGVLYIDCTIWSWRELIRSKNDTELLFLFTPYKIILLDKVHAIPEFEDTFAWICMRFPNALFLACSKEKTNADSKKYSYVSRPVHYISLEELLITKEKETIRKHIAQLVIYGMHTQVFENSLERAEEILAQLVSHELIMLVGKKPLVKKTEWIYQLLKILALHIGSELSERYLCDLLQVHISTIRKILDALAQMNVLFSLSPMHGKMLHEVRNTRKYYFYDTGIRNAILQNFTPLDSRTDAAALWENYCIAERIKQLGYHAEKTKTYYWRTYEGKEIKWIEVDAENKIICYDFLLSLKKNYAFPNAFIQTYKAKECRIIYPGNFI